MNGDSIVMKHVGDGSVRTYEQMLNEIEMLIGYYDRRPGLGVWAIELKKSREFVGAGGLTFNKDRDSKAARGYRIGQIESFLYPSFSFPTQFFNTDHSNTVTQASLSHFG